MSNQIDESDVESYYQEILRILLSDLLSPLRNMRGYAEMIRDSSSSDQPLRISPDTDEAEQDTSMTLRDCANLVIQSADHQRSVLDDLMNILKQKRTQDSE